MSVPPANASEEDVLSIVDLLLHPVDSLQISIADQWLQQWKKENHCWSTCISICKQHKSEQYFIFAMNTLISFLHQSFHLLSNEQQVEKFNDLISLTPFILNNPNCCRLLGNALAICLLLYTNQESLFENTIQYFVDNAFWNVLLYLLFYLPEENKDDRFSSIVEHQSNNQLFLQSKEMKVFYVLSLLSHNHDYYPMIFKVIDSWISCDLIQITHILENDLLSFLLTNLSTPYCLDSITSIISQITQQPVPLSILEDIAQQILSSCPIHIKCSLNASTLYLFNDFSSLPLKQYIKLVYSILDNGLLFYFEHPDCIFHQCFDLFILLLSYPHSDSLLEGIDCIESLLTDHEFIPDNTHPIYQQFYTIQDQLMQYMIIPLDVLQENLVEVKEIRSSISKGIVSLSHIIDEEESLEMILERIQCNDPSQLEGHFYTLVCLCYDMQYIENESLLELLYSIQQYQSLPFLLPTLITLITRLVHAISTVSTLYLSILQWVHELLLSNQYIDSSCDTLFFLLCKESNKHFSHNPSFFYSLLTSSFQPTNSSFAGLCYIVKNFSIPQQNEWIQNQTTFLLQSSLSNQKESLLCLSTLLDSFATSYSLLEIEQISQFLGSLLSDHVIRDDCIENWCTCCTSIGRLLISLHSTSFLPFLQLLSYHICNGSFSELITVFGDLIAYSLIHNITLIESISLIHEITQAILQVSQHDPNYTHTHQHLTNLFSLYCKCSPLKKEILQFQFLSSLIEIAIQSISSYHKELVQTSTSFLEMIIVVLEEQGVIFSYIPSIIQQCSIAIMDHSTTSLLYETSHTPLTLLYTLYSHCHSSFLSPFVEIFAKLNNHPSYQSFICSLEKPNLSVYQFNDIILKLYTILKSN